MVMIDISMKYYNTNKQQTLQCTIWCLHLGAQVLRNHYHFYPKKKNWNQAFNSMQQYFATALTTLSLHTHMWHSPLHTEVKVLTTVWQVLSQTLSDKAPTDTSADLNVFSRSPTICHSQITVLGYIIATNAFALIMKRKKSPYIE